MQEVVKVKNDHGVLSVRLPKTFIKEHRINRQSWMIWKVDRNGKLRLEPLKKGELDE